MYIGMSSSTSSRTSIKHNSRSSRHASCCNSSRSSSIPQVGPYQHTHSLHNSKYNEYECPLNLVSGVDDNVCESNLHTRSRKRAIRNTRDTSYDNHARASSKFEDNTSPGTHLDGNDTSRIDIVLGYEAVIDYSGTASEHPNLSSSTSQTINETIFDLPTSYDNTHTPHSSHFDQYIALAGVGNWIDERCFQALDGRSHIDTAYPTHIPKNHVRDALRDFEEGFFDSEGISSSLYACDTQ